MKLVTQGFDIDWNQLSRAKSLRWTIENSHNSSLCNTQQLTQPPLALSVPLSRFASQVGGGSAFFVRSHSRMRVIPTSNKAWSIFCFRGLIWTCVALSLAILWSVKRDDVNHTIFMATAICGFLLLAASLIYLKRLGRLAVYGLVVSILTLFSCILPTV